MWITRDKEGYLQLFEVKQYKVNDSYGEYWDFDEGQATHLPVDLEIFPDLTWNDEPIEVEIIPKSNLDVNKLSNMLSDTLKNTNADVYNKLVNILDKMSDEDKDKEWEDLKSYNDFGLPINKTIDDILKQELN